MGVHKIMSSGCVNMALTCANIALQNSHETCMATNLCMKILQQAQHALALSVRSCSIALVAFEFFFQEIHTVISGVRLGH